MRVTSVPLRPSPRAPVQRGSLARRVRRLRVRCAGPGPARVHRPAERRQPHPRRRPVAHPPVLARPGRGERHACELVRGCRRRAGRRRPDRSRPARRTPAARRGVEGESSCEGVEGDPIVHTAVWDTAFAAAEDEDPDPVLTEDLGSIRFEDDGTAFTIALAPEGADLPAPTSLEDLAGVGSDLGVDPADVPEDTPSEPGGERTTEIDSARAVEAEIPGRLRGSSSEAAAVGFRASERNDFYPPVLQRPALLDPGDSSRRSQTDSGEFCCLCGRPPRARNRIAGTNRGSR